MPRGERPLDAAGGPLPEFAGKLRKLREEAGGPTYRILAERAHYSIAALSGAAGGRQLPTLAVTLAYVRACGGDEREWERIWRRTAADCATPAEEESPGSRPLAASAPYVGLAAFQQADADAFFGREKLTGRLVGHLAEKRMLVLFGPSGSGKSSVLRAGLLPRFPGRPVLLMTPGAHPLEECAIHLAARTRTPAGALVADLTADPRNLHRTLRQVLVSPPRSTDSSHPHGADSSRRTDPPLPNPPLPPDPEGELLLVVDQFEEVFTLCASPGERDAFIASLLHVAQVPESRCRVVLAVRSDFYTHCAQYPDLVERLAEAHVPVGPMTTDELRAAIVRPAARGGLTVEGALVTTLTADAQGRPGALPLLSHALLETWHRRRGNALTLAGFRAAGGFEGALAQTAEEFHTRLSDSQQELARRLFLRLVALGEGTEDTRRRVPRTELDAGPDSGFVLEQATRARLLTVDRDHVELTHEVLIGCWPRLGHWLHEDRDRLRLQRRLTEATALWESLDRDPDTLYRGLRLAVARELPRDALTAPERAFLDAGEDAEREQALRVRRRVRRLRRLVAALVVLLVCAVTAVGLALDARLTITAQRNHALALQAADASVDLRTRDRSLAVQVALAAYRLAPAAGTRDGLLSALTVRLADRSDPKDAPGPDGPSPAVHALAVTPDGRTLATSDSRRRIVLWDMRDPRRPVRLSSVGGLVDHAHSLVFGPGGRTLLGIGAEPVIHVWDTSDPRDPEFVSRTATGHRDFVYALAVGPGGRLAATGSYDGTVRLWNVADPGRPRLRSELTGHSRNVKPVAFSPDGRVLASGSDDRTVRLWDVTDPDHVTLICGFEAHRNFVDTLAYSPDGRTLVTGSDDRTARLWDVTDPRRPRPLAQLTGHIDVVNSVTFAPDGRTVVTAAEDGAVQQWDVSDPSHPHLLAQLTSPAGAVTVVRHLAARGALVTAGVDRTAHVWNTDLSSALVDACARVQGVIGRARWSHHFPGLEYLPPCAEGT
ncbi:XRE family transcriptional regulator [Streptomyces sp. NBC_00414]|uniref:nSTAND1 domain-containing NTPase n=1 Tax=Streptomyces sp. NBC_00414 TaxID=2975739 RepID=UPI002E2446E3